MERARVIRMPVLALAALLATPGVGTAGDAIRAPPRRATIAGHVLTAPGKPLPGAEVMALVAPDATTEGDCFRRTLSDANGWFALDLPGAVQAPVHLVVRAAGRETRHVADARPGAPLELTLGRGATVSGHLTADEDEAPVTAAHVRLEVPAGWKPRPSTGVKALERLLAPEAVSDARGAWRITGVAPGAYQLVAEAPGRRRASRDLPLAAGDERTLPLRLVRDRVLAVAVRGPEGPLAGAPVRLVPIAGTDATPWPATLRATTGAKGRAELHGLEAGARYALHVAPGGLGTIVRELTVPRDGAESTQRIALALTPAVRVSGTVEDEAGLPLARAVVLLEDPTTPLVIKAEPYRLARLKRQATDGLGWPGGPREGDRAAAAVLHAALTDDAGRFAIEDAPPGTYAPRVLLGLNAYPTGTDVTLEPGTPADLGALRVTLGKALAGRVVDEDGSPIASARLSISDWSGRDGAGYLVARSGADGRFAVRGIRQRQCNLAAAALGFSPGFLAGIACPAPDVVVKLARAESISGHAWLPGGIAPQSVSVELVWLSKGGRFPLHPPQEVATDPGDAGAWRIEGVMPSTYDVVLHVPGFAPATVAGVVVEKGRATRGVDAVLGRGAVVTGVVVRMSDGTPLDGALVETWEKNSTMPPKASARTAPDGTFRLEGLVPGSVSLRATREGFTPATLTPVLATPDPIDPPARLALGHGGTLVGRVDTAAAGLRVAVWSRGGASEYVATTVDPSGRFRVEPLAAGAYSVAVDPGGNAPRRYPSREFLVTEGETTEVDLSPPPGRLHGTVTRAGKPVPGATIALRSTSGALGLVQGVTAEDGRYAVTGVAPGEWWVAISGERAAGIEHQSRITLGPEADGEAEKSFVLPARFASGRVLGYEDAPVEGASVTASDATINDEWYLSSTSHAHGAFRVALARAGPIRLTATSDGEHGELTLVAPEGGLTNVEIYLVATRFVCGRVVDRDGRAVGGARVSLFQTGVLAEQETSADGRFVFHVAGPNGDPVALRIMASARGFGPVVEYAKTEQELVLTLAPAGDIDVLVLGTAEERARVEVSFQAEDTVARFPPAELSGMSRVDTIASDGHVRFGGLAPGTYEISLRTPGVKGVTEASVDVTAGHTTLIEIPVR